MNENVIKVLNLSKESLQMTAKRMIDQVTEAGDVDPMDMYAQATAMETIAKNIKAGVRDYVTEQLMGAESSIVRSGVKFTIAERKTMAFDHCDAWKSRKNELDRVAKLMKNIDHTVHEEDTGEEINPAKVKYTQTVLSCELPK